MGRMPQVTAREIVAFLKAQGFAARILKAAGFSLNEFLQLR